MKAETSFSNNKRLKVINFFAGPGVGKSTLAAALFSRMKAEHYKVEFVQEFAKDMVWDERYHTMLEQDYVFANQHHLIRRLTRHDVKYAIVDSSLILGLLYAPIDFPPTFKLFVLDVFNSYDNVNILLERDSNIQYVQTGRNENEEQSIEKDKEIRSLLDDNDIYYWTVPPKPLDEKVEMCLDIIKLNSPENYKFEWEEGYMNPKNC